MDNSSFSMLPFSQDGALVTILLVVIGVLAVLTIIGMVVGARLRRQRAEAEREEQARIEELKADGVEVTTGDEATPAVDTRQAASSVQTQSSAPSERPSPQLNQAPAPAETPARDEDGAPTDRTTLADEPIPAAAPLDATPASVAADTPIEAAPAAGGSITQLKGLGPKIAARLGELGITDVNQLAWLDDAEAAQLDAQLGAFQGRMERDRWREQARLLAQGDRAGYEAQFGKLG